MEQYTVTHWEDTRGDEKTDLKGMDKDYGSVMVLFYYKYGYKD